MEYQLNGTLTEADFLAMHMLNSKKYRALLLTIFNIYILIHFVRFFISTSLLISIGASFFLLPLLVGFNFIVYFLLKYVLKINSRKVYKSGKINILPREIHINNRELQQKTDISLLTLTPELIYKVSYNTSAIYIYPSINQAIFLQKKGLKNEDWAEFQDFIKQNWDPQNIR